MKVAGLFAGIGGLEIGLSAAGHQTIALSEIDRCANAVLKARIDAPNLGDVRSIESLPEDTELLTAGFPCQDLSQAGRTVGIDGARSGLIGEVFRLLDDKPTDWVLLENVPFMLRLDGGSGMTRLVEAFEARGYRWAYRVVDTQTFLPQRRERVLFLASRTADPAEVLLVSDAQAIAQDTSLSTHAHGFYWTEGIRGLGWGRNCIPTLKNGSTVGIASPPAILMPSGAIILPDLIDAERLQGFAADWTKPAEDVARPSFRWSLVGNAVSVPVASWLGASLAAPDNYDRGRDDAFGNRWPKAARFDGLKRHAVQIGPHPVTPHATDLHTFLSRPGKALSQRATAGFLLRTHRGNLRFQPGFIDAIEAHLARMIQDVPLAA